MEIEQIIDIVKKLRNKEIDYPEVPFKDILDTITKLYSPFTNSSNAFNSLYGELICSAMNHDDRDALGNVLILLVNHISVMRPLMDKKTNNEDHLYSIIRKNFLEKEYYRNQLRVSKWHEKNGYSNVEPFTGKGCVYSVITGNYDDVKEPSYVNEEYDYILFTNNPDIKSDFWKIIYLDNEENLSNVMLQRKTKILGHKELDKYDYTIYVDGKMVQQDDISEMINAYKGHEPLLCFPHPGWNNIVDEKNRIVELGKADEDKLVAQIEAYKREGFPLDFGLIDSAVLVRNHHDERLIKAMEIWWEEMGRFTHRDQMSFPYACWKSDFVYDAIPIYIYGNKYFKLYAHN